MYRGRDIAVYLERLEDSGAEMPPLMNAMAPNVVKPTYCVSPYILHDPGIEDGAPLRLLLAAILTKEGVEELFALLGSSSVEDQLKNLWLMGPSARNAFHRGQIYIFKLLCLESDNGIRSTRNNNGATGAKELDHHQRTAGRRADQPRDPQHPPSDQLPQRHTPGMSLDTVKMSRATGAKELDHHQRTAGRRADQPRDPQHNKGSQESSPTNCIALKLSPSNFCWAIGSVGIFFLRNFLSILPKFVRLALYNFIDRQLDSRDPTQTDQPVKYLPLGLCLKRGRRIDESSGFVLMTQVYGHALNQVYYRITHEELEQIAKDLARWITELRKIPNKSKHLIANASGGPICDHMYEGRTLGPLNSTAEFADDLTQFLFQPEQHKHQPPIATLYEKK
ncbi:uncharacterized protein BDCG_03283 [Blastomyces dermatitidis ER-3]|uniref:Uncharacterized protein n=1 Tax=Ajellomyces dermatitidis (strain ER-3 / ATCC MYA-2586) TaxID=559297 RepID=A0ABM9YHF5_AJEDR|nr:uncharacterized protein BDCG_03283 [Blastomyces dermatitidis ER-3]EEQ88163.2 hypothetical protein BDCG_03283 [Blastomyces dermatitidis ER-3]